MAAFFTFRLKPTESHIEVGTSGVEWNIWMNHNLHSCSLLIPFSPTLDLCFNVSIRYNKSQCHIAAGVHQSDSLKCQHYFIIAVMLSSF